MKELTISRKSLHYRMVEWMYANPLWEFGRGEPRSLCSYGRRLAFTLFVFYPLIVPILSPAFIMAGIVGIITRNSERVRIVGITSAVLIYIALPWVLYLYVVAPTYGWKYLLPWLQLPEKMPVFPKILTALFSIELILIAIVVALVAVLYIVFLITVGYTILEEKANKARYEEEPAGTVDVLIHTGISLKEKICPPIHFVD